MISDERFKTVLTNVIGFLYPTRCGLCGIDSLYDLCDKCRGEFVPLVPSVYAEFTGPLAYVGGIVRYETRGAQAVKRLKYGRITSLVKPMAELMALGMVSMKMEPDVVIPIPIHWSRRFSRGFNQAEVLAERLPHVDLKVLKRIRKTKPQVSLTREERAKNLTGAFLATGNVAGKEVLLVDDVFTTGSTARVCAEALLEAGARRVGVLVFAVEP